MKNEKTHSNKWGGKRKGAGNKPKNGIARSSTIAIQVTPIEKEQVKKYAMNKGKPVSKIIRDLLTKENIITSTYKPI